MHPGPVAFKTVRESSPIPGSQKEEKGVGTVSWMMTTSNTSQHFSPDEFDAFGIVQTAAVQRAACNLLPQGLKTAFVNKILLWKITDALLLSSKPSTTTLTKEEVRLTCSSALCYY